MLGDMVTAALRKAWETASELQLPVAIIGGIALTVWRHPRNTRDVDLLIDSSKTDPDSLVRSMQERGFRPMRFPALVNVGTARFIEMLYTPPGTFVDIKVDLQLAESEYQRTALMRRTLFDLPEHKLRIEAISCEDLILHKLLAERMIDRADVVALLRANATSLDWTYLAEWLPKLTLQQIWSDCWREAFPGEPDPLADPTP
jgi:hypothetical protein